MQKTQNTSIRVFGLLTGMLAFALVAALPIQAQAETETYVETICETGAYGQVTCREEEREKIKGVERVDELHDITEVDTSIPGMIALAGAAASTLAGSGYGLYRLRK